MYRTMAAISWQGWTTDLLNPIPGEKSNSSTGRELEGKGCGERKGRLCAAFRVDLVCHRAGHQTAPFSTGRPNDLLESSLEDSSTAAPLALYLVDQPGPMVLPDHIASPTD
jgi:hypothetical protein